MLKTPGTEAAESPASTAELWCFSRKGSGGCGPGPLAVLEKPLLLLPFGAAPSPRGPAPALLGSHAGSGMSGQWALCGG